MVNIKETTRKRHLSAIHFSTLIKSTGNEIGNTGVKSLSDALKSNTTLTELYLWGEHKRNNTQMASINSPHFSILNKSTDNEIRKKGAASLSDALKSNITLTRLILSGEYKRNNTQMASVNNPLFFSSNQQGTTLETQVQRH